MRPVVEVRQDHARQRRADRALDREEIVLLVRRDERDHLAGGTGACGAAAAVDVVVGGERDVEIHDVRDPLDVDAARRDVGGDQHRILPATKRLERGDAVLLAAVGVDAGRADAAARDGACEAVGVDLALHEHEYRTHALALEERGEERRLAHLRDRIDALHDAARRPLRADHDRHRIAQDVLRELADLRRHRRREHQRLPLRRERAQDAADVGEEAHVEHAVSLVEDEHLERAEIDVVEAHVIKEPPRRRDDDLGAGAERALLRPHVDAADDRYRREPDVVAERERLLVDLQRQLTRRRENERVARAALPAVQALQDRQQKRRGLAGAGRRAADQVAAGEADRNRLGLDRRRPRVPHVGNRFGERGNETEVVKRVHVFALCAESSDAANALSSG